MAEAGQSRQLRGQDAPDAQEINTLVPMDLEQTVKRMMQQMVAFKKDARLRHLFAQEEVPVMAQDTPRLPVQVEVQQEVKSRKRERTTNKHAKKKHHKKSKTSSSSSSSFSSSSSSSTSSLTTFSTASEEKSKERQINLENRRRRNLKKGENL